MKPAIRRGIVAMMCVVLVLSVQIFTAWAQTQAEEAREKAIEAPQPANPDAPGEFQRLVAASTGRSLPVFGAALFRGTPTTFAPIDRVPVTADYVIGPGDEIILRVWGQQNFDLNLPVDRLGNVYIPQVGNISVAGIQFQNLSSHLRTHMERVFRNFEMNVNMGHLRSIQIYVLGYAHHPGTYTISSLSTLVNALSATGGPSARGTMRRIQLKRGDQTIVELDLYDLLLRGDKTRGDVKLLPEDVIYIPPVGPLVAVAGSLKNPAIYEIRNEKTIGDVIQLAGGFSVMASRDDAVLERVREGLSREVVNINLDSRGMNTAVADGDILQVLQILPKFDNVVTLRGNVATHGRFSWHPGMRIKDLIPEKDSLITRDYWRKRNSVGSSPIIDDEEQTRIIEFSEPDINWSYALIERQNPGNLNTELIPFNLGRLVLENDQSQNLELRSGDVVTIFSQADIRVPQMQQTRTVRLEGEFNAPGIYVIAPGETLGDIIRKAGGLTPQAYLFGATFTRESVRKEQQESFERYLLEFQEDIDREITEAMANAMNNADARLEATALQRQRQSLQRLKSLRATGRIVLSLKPGSNDISGIYNMALENGDRFFMPTRPAIINVIGEVYNPSSLMHAEKRKIEDYVQLSGGFTRNADQKHVYVLRADGTVLPKQNISNLFNKELNPGDAVIVPVKIIKPSFMVELRNWAKIFADFGLGAAAIRVLLQE